MQVSTRMWVRQVGCAAARILWPSCCVICQRRGQAGLDLCSACESLLTPLTRVAGTRLPVYSVESLCVCCGSPVSCSYTQDVNRPNDHNQSTGSPLNRALRCQACVNVTSQFADILSPYRFDFPLDHLIHRLKYQHRRELARVFGVLLAKAARTRLEQGGSHAPMPQLLLPVPAHPKRLIHRDFNQAADIARWCASELGLRAVPGWARRIIDTPSLAGMSRSERQLCIRGAFSVDARVADRDVAIVDDVLTSGATTGELARELLDTGAASVQLWVLARTPSEGSSNRRLN